MKIFFCLILIFTFWSCTPLYYAPNTHNVPMLTEHWQSNLEIAKGGSAETNTFEVQGAFSPLRGIGIMGNFTRFESDKEGGATVYGGASLSEFGGGYYHPFSKYGLIDIYGGYGWGSAAFYDDSEYTSFSHSRYFLQPGLGFHSNIFDAHFSLKGIYQTYSDVATYPAHPPYTSLSTISPQWFLEPSLTLKVGYELVKIRLQLVISDNLVRDNFPQDNFHGSIGLTFNLKPSYFK